MAFLLGVAAFFLAIFGAGYVLGWLRGARWLDDPSPPSCRAARDPRAASDPPRRQDGGDVDSRRWR